MITIVVCSTKNSPLDMDAPTKCHFLYMSLRHGLIKKNNSKGYLVYNISPQFAASHLSDALTCEVS